DAAAARALDIDFREHAVLDHGDPRFLGGGVYEYLFTHRRSDSAPEPDRRVKGDRRKVNDNDAARRIPFRSACAVHFSPFIAFSSCASSNSGRPTMPV